MSRRLVLNGGPSPGVARSPGREARRERALRGGGRVGGRSLGRILDVFNRRATKRTGPAARQRRREPFNTSLLDRVFAVERVFQDLARLEGQHSARGDGDFLARLGITASARILVAHDEVAEPGDLYLLAAFESRLDGIEDRLDDLSCLFLGEAPDLLVDRLDDVGLSHGAMFPQSRMLSKTRLFGLSSHLSRCALVSG